MTLAHINQFETDKPDKLSRQLSDLEDNVSDEFDSVRRQCVPQLQPARFVATPVNGIVAILPDQQLSVDTSQANAAVVFPPLSAKNFGRRFVLIKVSSLKAIATSCQDPAVLCNGTTFPAIGIGTVGPTVFYCDALGYYK